MKIKNKNKNNNNNNNNIICSKKGQNLSPVNL
jgi:hypothetical protein